MNMNNIIKFIYLGTAAWIYSIIAQTPFAIFVWHLDLNQYVAWAAAGLPITLIFFGSLLRWYLNWMNGLYDRVIESKKEND